MNESNRHEQKYLFETRLKLKQTDRKKKRNERKRKAKKKMSASSRGRRRLLLFCRRKTSLSSLWLTLNEKRASASLFLQATRRADKH